MAFNVMSNGALQNIVDSIRNAAQNQFNSQDEVLQAPGRAPAHYAC